MRRRQIILAVLLKCCELLAGAFMALPFVFLEKFLRELLIKFFPVISNVEHIIDLVMLVCLMSYILVSYFPVWKFYKDKLEDKVLLERKLEKVPVFQPPHDLTPLILSQCIFQIDVSSNVTDRTIEGSITYLSLIQATLLDWIDRVNLSLVEKEGRGYFRVNHYNTLSTYELDVMDLLFANIVF